MIDLVTSYRFHNNPLCLGVVNRKTDKRVLVIKNVIDIYPTYLRVSGDNCDNGVYVQLYHVVVKVNLIGDVCLVWHEYYNPDIVDIRLSLDYGQYQMTQVNPYELERAKFLQAALLDYCYNGSDDIKFIG